METLTIGQHSIAGWKPYADRFGFVPDPMILRASEIFLNGLTGSARLQRKDFEVWHALQQNIGGIMEFFDLLVTRDVIPLINYGDSFDRMGMEVPLDRLLGERVCPVEIDYAVYNEVKKGALLDLACVDIAKIEHAEIGGTLQELDAFRYDWKPRLDVPGAEPALDQARSKFANVDQGTLPIAQFLLGGLIFGGFAKATMTTHHIQPKRSRLYLGLTAGAVGDQGLSARGESAIFDTAMQDLAGSRIDAKWREAVPSILPYLMERGGPPKNARALLDRALTFRESAEGNKYRLFVDSVRGDGPKAAQSADLSKREREEAIKFLAPYSKLDPEKSRSLEVSVSSELVGVPGIEVSTQLGAPTWFRIWWNDCVPFGGIRKTLRRMWMAEESYRKLSGTLRDLWANT